jgi:biopolymer transport protein ExbD
MARPVPEINAGSMADIAFLLLIFFLVSTSMDTDRGLLRKLPPMPDPNAPESKDVIKERNVFIVLINSNNDLQVEGQLMNVAELREAAKEFIDNPENKDNLSEMKEMDVPLLGPMRVSKGVISLQNDRGTSYEMYIKVQNELIAAYNELREKLSMQKFSKKFDNLNEEQQDAIKEVYNQRISEAEPKNVGGQ